MKRSDVVRGLCPSCFAVVEVRDEIYLWQRTIEFPCGCEVGAENQNDDIPF